MTNLVHLMCVVFGIRGEDKKKTKTNKFKNIRPPHYIRLKFTFLVVIGESLCVISYANCCKPIYCTHS
jgi:hypothetical protein